MADDQLSDILSLIEVRGMLTGGLAARGAWVSAAPIDHPLKFFAVLSGSARLRTEGLDAPLELVPGDIGILNNRRWVELRGGPADATPHPVVVQPDFPPLSLSDDRDDDAFVGGRIDLDPAGQAFLLQALPPVAHVRATGALRDTVNRLGDELAGRRIGSAFAVRQYTQLLLLEMLRTSVEQSETLPPGWLHALADERLRPAITLMHTEPGRPWTLAELARTAAMSRASFADRFRRAAGIPPLTYLSRYRMMLAQRALGHGDARVGAVATQLGYGSESAFSNAFKREVGISPAHFRRRVRRTEADGPADTVVRLDMPAPPAAGAGSVPTTALG